MVTRLNVSSGWKYPCPKKRPTVLRISIDTLVRIAFLKLYAVKIYMRSIKPMQMIDAAA